MWLGKRLLMLVVGVMLILGLIVFSGCVKQDVVSEPETSAETTTEAGEATEPAEEPEPDASVNDQEILPAAEEKQEMVTNGSFTKGIDGWVLAGGRIRSEAGGNKYLEAENNWQNYQIVNLEPNAVYTFNASTRRKSGEQEARIKIIFFNKHAQRLGWYSIHYKHEGNAWENIPVQTIKVPDGTSETIIYVLADREKEVHDFDDISLIKEGIEITPVTGEEINLVFNSSPEKLANGSFDFESGWAGLEGRIKKDTDGNRYLVCGYHWEVSQAFPLLPGTKYQFTAATKKGTATGPARFVLVFFNDRGEKLAATYNLSYQHQGDGWENIPAEEIEVPEGVSQGRLYIISDYAYSGTHDYDNLSLTEVK
jgi:hypothetical protein